MTNTFTYKRGFTHNGKFHADDVFAAALLILLNPEIIIERGAVVPENYEGIVFDIGCGEYDHHQAAKEYRENGVPYAAFGLLWRAFGKLLLKEEEALKFDRFFVQKIDRCDNSAEKNLLSTSIGALNPMNAENEDECFHKAVSMAYEILKAFVQKLQFEAESKKQVSEMIGKTDEPVLFLEQWQPWREAVLNTKICFVIYPSDRGGYCVSTVPKETGTQEQKICFPNVIAGMPKEKLESVTKIKGFSFCHAGGFLACTETLDGAKELVRWTVMNSNCEYRKDFEKWVA